jgi:hypothetical protein
MSLTRADVACQRWRKAHTHQIDDRILHGDLDLLAFVGALSLVKSGQDSDCGVKAAA